MKEEEKKMVKVKKSQEIIILKKTILNI